MKDLRLYPVFRRRVERLLEIDTKPTDREIVLEVLLEDHITRIQLDRVKSMLKYYSNKVGIKI